MISTASMVPVAEMKTWKGQPIVDVQRNIDKQTYLLFLKDGSKVELTDQFVETQGEVGTYEEGYTKEQYDELQARLDKYKDEMAKTTMKIKEAFEEKIKNEQRLRAEAEERAEHLQDEVSKLRGELQGRDEQNRKYLGTPSDKHYTFTYTTDGRDGWVEQKGASVSDVSTDSVDAAILTGWKNSSVDRSDT